MQRSRSLPASSGWHWFLSALQATRNQPVVLTGIVLLYMFLMSMLSVLPWVGPALAALFMPFGTVFVGRATRTALAGGQPSFSILADIWRDVSHRQSLVRIGLVFGFVLVTVNALYGWLAADEISRWVITDNNRLDWASVRANIPWDATLAMLVVYIPGLMAVWFAPLLASEKHMPCGKACFFSFFGCLRNILPVLVLGLVITVVATAVTAAGALLISALELQDSAMVLLTPLVFLISTVIYASYWPMYADLFDDVA